MFINYLNELVAEISMYIELKYFVMLKIFSLSTYQNIYFRIDQLLHNTVSDQFLVGGENTAGVGAGARVRAVQSRAGDIYFVNIFVNILAPAGECWDYFPGAWAAAIRAE